MKLSIIIPVYNTEKYIKQCIESVTAIKDIETEIIAVNDGSTDSSKDILEEYTEKNDRIKVITQKKPVQETIYIFLTVMTGLIRFHLRK